MKVLSLLFILALLFTFSLAAQADLHAQEIQGVDPQQLGEPEPFEEESDLQEVPPEQGSINQKEVDQHIKAADVNSDGLISFEEHDRYFRKHVIQQQNEEWQEYIKDFYDYLDQDGDKSITTQEYRSVFQGPPEQTQADIQHQGQIPAEDEGLQDLEEQQMTDEEYINAEHAHHQIPLENIEEL